MIIGHHKLLGVFWRDFFRPTRFPSSEASGDLKNGLCSFLLVRETGDGSKNTGLFTCLFETHAWGGSRIKSPASQLSPRSRDAALCESGELLIFRLLWRLWRGHNKSPSTAAALDLISHPFSVVQHQTTSGLVLECLPFLHIFRKVLFFFSCALYNLLLLCFTASPKMWNDFSACNLFSMFLVFKIKQLYKKNALYCTELLLHSIIPHILMRTPSDAHCEILHHPVSHLLIKLIVLLRRCYISLNLFVSWVCTSGLWSKWLNSVYICILLG